MIQEKGGLLAFIRYFEQGMEQEEFMWLQKCKNRPAHDIAFVYIIACNQVRYKLYYGGYQTGAAEVYNGNGQSWCSKSVITWPRLVLAGPVQKAPRKIYMRGFQGFRYVYEELF